MNSTDEFGCSGSHELGLGSKLFVTTAQRYPLVDMHSILAWSDTAAGTLDGNRTPDLSPLLLQPATPQPSNRSRPSDLENNDPLDPGNSMRDMLY